MEVLSLVQCPCFFFFLVPPLSAKYVQQVISLWERETRYCVDVGPVFKISALIQHLEMGMTLPWSVLDIKIALPNIKERVVVSGRDRRFSVVSFTSTPINVQWSRSILAIRQ